MSVSISSVVQELVAPAILISANGLLCLALYNRLAAIVGRLRTFHIERLNLLAPLRSAETAQRLVLRSRLDELGRETDHIVRRARLVRDALVGLLSGVLCLLACPILIGIGMFAPAARGLVLLFFVAGVAAAVVGIIYALCELAISLRQVESEHASLAEVFSRLHDEEGA